MIGRLIIVTFFFFWLLVNLAVISYIEENYNNKTRPYLIFGLTHATLFFAVKYVITGEIL